MKKGRNGRGQKTQTVAAAKTTARKPARKKLPSKAVKSAVPSRRLKVPARKKPAPYRTRKTSAKKVSSAKPHRPLPLEENGPLPFSYGQTKIVVMVRDPEWAYSYWDFSGDTWNWIASLRQSDGAMRAVLRVHNLSQKNSYDLDVELEAKNWYLHLGVPDAEFEVELGLLDSRGRFHRIAKSNRVRTPRSGPSDRIDPEWDPSNFDELYRLSGGGAGGRSSAELSSQFKKQK